MVKRKHGIDWGDLLVDLLIWLATRTWRRR